MNIAILTTGKSRGSNFVAIHDYLLKNNIDITIKYIFATDDSAPIIQHAKLRNIKVILYKDRELKINDFLIDSILNNPVDLLVLTGFMRKISKIFFQYIKIPMINIHPALLPKFGGKGMFGMNVHNAVFEAKEKISGATVHYVNEDYDKGNIIYQKECCISDCSTPEDIAKKVLKVEHEIYPITIKNILFCSKK